MILQNKYIKYIILKIQKQIKILTQGYKYYKIDKL